MARVHVTAMITKWLALVWLPLHTYGWWCETSKRHGCRGQSRHFVREASTAQLFLAFQDIKTDVTDEPIVVDWDHDGDLDVILRSKDKLSLFEFRAGSHFVEVEPNPFRDVPGGSCRPAVVDWDGDGALDLIVGSEDGIRYYHTGLLDRQLHLQRGEDNPFSRINTQQKSCSDLAIGDWDGDGNLDILESSYDRPMQFFEQSEGELVLEEGPTNPFHEIMNQTRRHRPVMADWNGDGKMDLLLLPKQQVRMETGRWPIDQHYCTLHLYEQRRVGGKMALVSQDDPVFRNEGCKSFDGSGASLVDVDADGDLDAIFGSFDGPLYVYERTAAGLVKPRFIQSNSTPLDMIRLNDTFPSGVRVNFLHPVLADWDLDGDLDLALLHIAGETEKNRYFVHLPDDTVTELKGPPNSSCPIDWGRHFSVADFDGDGKQDILGFQTRDQVVVCLQSAAGFEVVNPDDLPFNINGHICLHCLPDENIHASSGWGFPVFVDWDSDGDMDMLRMNAADKVYLHEQLSNGTVFAHALPLPPSRDFSASDFDGDGDVDIMLIPYNSDDCLYFERQHDGSLQQLFGTDNPFNAVCKETNIVNNVSPQSFAALGDWDADGERDFILVDESKVALWTNRLLDTFIEVTGKDNPFRRLGLQDASQVTIVDVNDDGRLDIVVPPQTVFTNVWGYNVYRTLEQGTDGLLDERLGAANPFDKVYYNETEHPYAYQPYKNTIVDLDGDGDLDIVDGELHYARNDDGNFTYLSRDDPDHPFRGIPDNPFSCWTFVDWDRDGDLDLVLAYMPGPAGSSYKDVSQYAGWATQVYVEMGKNGTSLAERDAWYEEHCKPQIRFYRNVNVSFQEVTGPANPFHGIGPLLLSSHASCPAFADLDNDGMLELVLGVFDGTLQHFEQKDGQFRHVANTPLADISIKGKIGPPSLKPQFLDWDGDGRLDLLLTGMDQVKLFQRGVCIPSSSYCKSGACNQRTSSCTCSAGAEGPDCTLCGNFHVRENGACAPCPGHNGVAGTCSRRGVCEDDADARRKQLALNLTGSKVNSARGTGKCTCSPPFKGHGCTEGECPAGEYLDRHAKVAVANEKYKQWEACAPCPYGKFKNVSGNEDCSACPGGHIPVNRTACIPCSPGRFPSADYPEECVDCLQGDVAGVGATSCTPCQAGTEPSKDRSVCLPCPAGAYARPRWGKCQLCPLGSIPNAQKTGCDDCMGQTYSLAGDADCRPCNFPSMMSDEYSCTPLYTVLFMLMFVLVAFCVLAIFGRLRLEYLKRRLNKLVAARKWQDLHATQARPFPYGLWHGKARKLLALRKADVKSHSLQLGVSLQYVFDELETTYNEKAERTEWRMDEWGPITRSGFLAKARSSGIAIHAESAWLALPICDHPEDPNFHQLAGLLAYGPLALGKGLSCPRDGQPDCSLVDALEVNSQSARSTWFLSWVWSYKFTTVVKALARWWQRHSMVTGNEGRGIYMWWCLFVNNQFRLLEAGQVQEVSDFSHVFGRQLESTGKMLMCLDKLRGSQYTTRIWCIFEVFIACQRSIPTTVILPELEVGAIESLTDLTRECRVDAEQAKASVQADADAIKERIQKEHRSFEYVNQTVEQALWCEVIKFLEQSGPSEQSEQSTGGMLTQTPEDSDISTSWQLTEVFHANSVQSQCNLQ